MEVAVRHEHESRDDMLKFDKQILRPGIFDILPIGHKVVESAIPAFNVLPGGSLNEYDDLQSDFEQEQICFDALGGVDIYRFKVNVIKLRILLYKYNVL